MVCWFLSSFVSTSLQVLIEKLSDFGIKACESISDVDNKLRELRRTLLRVQSFIHDAEEKQINDMAWQVLLQDLEEIAYDADDLIDEIVIQASKLQGGKHNPVSKLLLSLYKRTSGPNMTDLQAKLDGMLREIHSLCLRQLVQSKHLDLLVSKLQTSSLTDESHVFGRETDKKRIIQMLLSSEESPRGHNMSVIPIVSMIGVGKTTLAQLVYNHDYQETMVDPFNLKMWVSVTRDFDVMRLTRSIIEAAGCESAHLLNLESLHLELKRIIREKRFLLVLDDVWNEKPYEWDLLLKPLNYGIKGSKIIVTTRSHIVSSLVGTDGPYPLKCLSDEDCWLLLKKEALGDINLSSGPELDAIGINIAKKCKGFPLTAKSVGRLLHSNIRKDEWNDVLKSKIWDLPVVQNEVVPALRSSCDHLPSHLKQCFAYCAMFPQSYEFEKVKTIQMWMGEGFIIPHIERKMVEDTGSYYFDQLFLTSFFQIEGEKYKMHDAAHDLAQSVFGDKFSRMEEPDDSSINVNTRHLSLICEKSQRNTCEATYGSKGLRTFLLFSKCAMIIKEVPHATFLKLGRLRVLDLSSTQIEELAKGIGNLKHLRFLDLSNTLVKWLPETMQELCVLQTLRLVNCSELLCLPKSTSRLNNLRHLLLGGGNQLSSMPSGIGKLTGLRTVSEFIVGHENGQMKELKDLKNLQGSLCIKQLEKVKTPQEALEANLAEKRNIDELELRWTYVVDARNDEHVLDKLMSCPHENLKKLTIQRYGGRMFPKWISNPLFSQLTSIFFNECKNCGLLPPLGQLPNLKFLKVVGMDELIVVDEMFLGDGTGFQSLETLELRDFPKLKRWVGLRDKDMACLRELTIAECPQMVSLPPLHYLRFLEKLEFESCPQLPALPEEGLSSSIQSLIIMECPLLEELCNRDGGEDWIKIEHIPYIEIDYENVRELESGL